jgi:hypothetical protein
MSRRFGFLEIVAFVSFLLVVSARVLIYLLPGLMPCQKVLTHFSDKTLLLFLLLAFSLSKNCGKEFVNLYQVQD